MTEKVEDNKEHQASIKNGNSIRTESSSEISNSLGRSDVQKPLGASGPKGLMSSLNKSKIPRLFQSTKSKLEELI